jgi:maltooligosyltrehalose trehalohydrolase
MKRRHEMPFGAECRNDGSVRFRLWAPAAKKVELRLQSNAVKTLPLNQLDDGWFELVTNAAPPGSQYKFRINGEQEVPDPASRFQPHDVHGPSEVVDPTAFDWQDRDWRGRQWEDAVIYELHVGAFTQAGKFCGVEQRLDHLADLGITAIELMPLSDFPGGRNWGYDGVLPFAPDNSYGRPEHLKQLIQAAHARDLMVLLDVVYNHFGPEGNYLGVYAPQFFTDRHRTPWGSAINFDGTQSRAVRDFFINNALYWLTEYHFDGLRLDAADSIVDDSPTHILTELAEAVRNTLGEERQIHLVLENDRNQASHLRRTDQCQIKQYSAQWDDDIHHAAHVLVTGEKDGYYSDYSDHPLDHLGRCLVSGFAYQGEVSLYRNSKTRGESTAGLPLTAFVSFLQNHDQIGNRALGERIATLADPQAVQAAMAIFLLAPLPPLLFMGEEFGSQTPFLFFCEFEKDLAAAVTAGRRNEFARFTRFSDPDTRKGIPDPNAVTTFEHSKIDWEDLRKPQHQEWLRFYRKLLDIRQRQVVPHLSTACTTKASYEVISNSVLSAHWKFTDGFTLSLAANLGTNPVSDFNFPAGEIIYTTEKAETGELHKGNLPAWSVVWFLNS